jgi:hypothetical protein
MHLINNQPYFDFKPHIDFEGLKAIEKDLHYGIVMCKDMVGEGCASTHNLYNKDTETSLIDLTWPQQLEDPTNPNYEYYKKFNFDRRICMTFARYTEEATQMGQILWLRVPKAMNASHAILSKGFADMCRDTGAYVHFPSLREWISKLPVFEQVGRINFFLHAPGEPGQLHHDSFTGFPDNFMLINLNPARKEVYLLDDNNNKIVIDSEVSTFDTRNWHGTINKEFYSWTLRIEGIFAKDWAQSVGIWDTFKQPHL